MTSSLRPVDPVDGSGSAGTVHDDLPDQGLSKLAVTEMGSTGDAPVTSDAEQLRRIQAVTDDSLSRLDLDDLLATLLKRVREILEADTAAILLLDDSSRELVATAAHGIEEEVRQGVRIPIGEGFAGRIAAERRPVVLDHVDHTTVANPILVDRGIRALVGVPLAANGVVVGVLHVGTLGARTFTSRDVELLQLAADRAALAIQSGLSRRERVAATTLQRSLLPQGLPDIAGLEIASRYLPGLAGEVGGDWFDVFALPSGRVGAVIGDVVGHGLRSAVVMGRLRSALRAYALDSDNPATVLTRLDTMVSHFETDQMATVLYGVFEPSLREITLSSSGHLGPLLTTPDEQTYIIEVPPDPPIGVGTSVRHNTTVPVPAAATIYFFTDGVVERRGTDIEVGIKKLSAAARPGSPRRGCSRIVSELLGDSSPDDDFALLALHVSN